MRLLVDEDIQAKRLVHMLLAAGHDILTVNEAGIRGQPDAVVFRTAQELDRTLLTRNPADFLALHAGNPVHPGVVAIYQDADPTKNMSYVDITQALGNLESTGLALPSQFHILNHYRW